MNSRLTLLVLGFLGLCNTGGGGAQCAPLHILGSFDVHVIKFYTNMQQYVLNNFQIFFLMK